jgi:putative colanic acid biosynthesis acetyltransferase WcaF
MMERDLSKFSNGKRERLGYVLVAALWYLAFQPLFSSRFCHSSLRVWILRLFKGRVGRHVLIKSGVRIAFPWNLEIGTHSWIGEGVRFINHARVSIDSNVCISQESLICSSGHDFKTSDLVYKHNSIEISKGVWICVRATVLAGAFIGENSVVSSGEVVRGEVPSNTLVIGGERIVIKYD